MQKEKLEIVRGDDVSFRLKFQTQDGNPLELLGARFDLHAKVEGQLVLALSTEDDSIRVDEQGILLQFAHAMTADAQWTQAEYDLQCLYNQKRKTLLGGKIKLIKDITEV